MGFGDMFSGALNAVKGAMDIIAPFAAMIPGVGMFAMAAKAAVDIGTGIANNVMNMAKQDRDAENLEEKIANTRKMQMRDFGAADMAT